MFFLSKKEINLKSFANGKYLLFLSFSLFSFFCARGGGEKSLDEKKIFLKKIKPIFVEVEVNYEEICSILEELDKGGSRSRTFIGSDDKMKRLALLLGEVRKGCLYDAGDIGHLNKLSGLEKDLVNRLKTNSEQLINLESHLMDEKFNRLGVLTEEEKMVRFMARTHKELDTLAGSRPTTEDEKEQADIKAKDFIKLLVAIGYGDGDGKADGESKVEDEAIYDMISEYFYSVDDFDAKNNCTIRLFDGDNKVVVDLLGRKFIVNNSNGLVVGSGISIKERLHMWEIANDEDRVWDAICDNIHDSNINNSGKLAEEFNTEMFSEQLSEFSKLMSGDDSSYCNYLKTLNRMEYLGKILYSIDKSFKQKAGFSIHDVLEGIVNSKGKNRGKITDEEIKLCKELENSYVMFRSKLDYFRKSGFATFLPGASVPAVSVWDQGDQAIFEDLKDGDREKIMNLLLTGGVYNVNGGEKNVRFFSRKRVVNAQVAQAQVVSEMELFLFDSSGKCVPTDFFKKATDASAGIESEIDSKNRDILDMGISISSLEEDLESLRNKCQNNRYRFKLIVENKQQAVVGEVDDDADDDEDGDADEGQLKVGKFELVSGTAKVSSKGIERAEVFFKEMVDVGVPAPAPEDVDAKNDDDVQDDDDVQFKVEIENGKQVADNNIIYGDGSVVKLGICDVGGNPNEVKPLDFYSLVVNKAPAPDPVVDQNQDQDQDQDQNQDQNQVQAEPFPISIKFKEGLGMITEKGLFIDNSNTDNYAIKKKDSGKSDNDGRLYTEQEELEMNAEIHLLNSALQPKLSEKEGVEKAIVELTSKRTKPFLDGCKGLVDELASFTDDICNKSKLKSTIDGNGLMEKMIAGADADISTLDIDTDSNPFMDHERTAFILSRMGEVKDLEDVDTKKYLEDRCKKIYEETQRDPGDNNGGSVAISQNSSISNLQLNSQQANANVVEAGNKWKEILKKVGRFYKGENKGDIHITEEIKKKEKERQNLEDIKSNLSSCRVSMERLYRGFSEISKKIGKNSWLLNSIKNEQVPVFTEISSDVCGAGTVAAGCVYDSVPVLEDVADMFEKIGGRFHNQYQLLGGKSELGTPPTNFLRKEHNTHWGSSVGEKESVFYQINGGGGGAFDECHKKYLFKSSASLSRGGYKGLLFPFYIVGANNLFFHIYSFLADLLGRLYVIGIIFKTILSYTGLSILITYFYDLYIISVQENKNVKGRKKKKTSFPVPGVVIKAISKTFSRLVSIPSYFTSTLSSKKSKKVRKIKKKKSKMKKGRRRKNK